MKKRFLALILAASMIFSTEAGIHTETLLADEEITVITESSENEEASGEPDTVETAVLDDTVVSDETESADPANTENGNTESLMNEETNSAVTDEADTAVEKVEEAESESTEAEIPEEEREDWPYDDEETDGIPSDSDDLQLNGGFSAAPEGYPNTWVNTGNQAEDIVNIARTQVGYEESSNHTKYNEWYYGTDKAAAWCAIFISWCANQAGIPTSIIKKNAAASGYSVKTMASNPYRTATAFAFGAKTPQAGDIIFVDNNSDEVSNHVGLVVSVDSKYIYTVEGNYQDQVSNVRYSLSTGARVYSSGTLSTQSNILFFARPAYTGTDIDVDDTAEQVKDEEDDADGESYDYSEYQTANASSKLNVRTGPGTEYKATGYFAAGSKTLIKVSEVQGNWGYTVTTTSTSTVAGWVCLDYCALISMGLDTVMTDANGLCQAVDGNWYYFNDGRIDYSFTGMVKSGSVWWLVTEGAKDTSYTGLYKYDGEWWYLVDGKFQSSFKGIVEGQYGWWYVVSGKIDLDYTGMVQSDSDWYLITDGKVDSSYTGVYECDDEGWYVVEGKFQPDYTGMVDNDNVRCYVVSGKLASDYTGMLKSDGVWIYIANGKEDTTYTGLAKNAYGWWYMNKGKLDLTYTGMAKNAYGWWYVTKGKLDLTYTGMAKNAYGWWYMTKGKLNTTFTGIGQNSYGYWYFKNGTIAYTYSGTVKYGGYTYKVTKGKAVRK